MPVVALGLAILASEHAWARSALAGLRGRLGTRRAPAKSQ